MIFLNGRDDPMTRDDLQKFIDWIDKNTTTHGLEVYNEDTKCLHDVSIVHFNELMEIMSHYPIEEENKECTADLDYKAEYRRLLAEVESLKEDIRILKESEQFAKNQLAKYQGAVAMTELIYGAKINM